jgi:hypothetical protein
MHDSGFITNDVDVESVVLPRALSK